MLDAPQPTGGTLRDALRGTNHPLMSASPLDPCVTHVWEWFGELQHARSSSGFAINPLSFAELQAWAALTGRTLTPFEVRLLKDLDLIYLGAVAKRGSDAEKSE